MVLFGTSSVSALRAVAAFVVLVIAADPTIAQSRPRRPDATEERRDRTAGAAEDPDLAGIPDLTSESEVGATQPATVGSSAISYEIAGNWRSWYNLNATDDPAESDELVSRMDLELTARTSAALSGKIGGRVRSRFDVTADEIGRAYEAELRDFYLAFVKGPLSLSLGRQVIRWGVADSFSPNDVINPVDLRDGPAIDFETPRIPVLALRAAVGTDEVTLEGVYVPLHEPHRAPKVRERWGFLDGQPILVDTLNYVEAAAEEEVGGDFDDAFASAPEPALNTGSLGARLILRPASVDLSLNAFYGWDRTPALVMDPALFVIAAAFANPSIDPDADEATRMAVDQLSARIAAGEPIATATPQRRLDLGADFAATRGRFVLKGEIAFTPEQTVYTESLAAVRSPALAWVFGFDFNPTEALQLTLEGGGRAVEPIVGERYQAIGGDEAAIAGAFRIAPPDSGFQAQLTGRYSFFHEDWAVSPSVQFRPWPPHAFSIGALFLAGPPNTFGGVLQTNDFIYLRYELLF